MSSWICFSVLLVLLHKIAFVFTVVFLWLYFVFHRHFRRPCIHSLNLSAFFFRACLSREKFESNLIVSLSSLQDPANTIISAHLFSFQTLNRWISDFHDSRSIMANDDLSQIIRIDIPVLVTMAIISHMLSNRQRRQMLPREPSFVRDIHRNAHMARIFDGGIHNCVEYIRMSKDTFLRLCTILRERGHLRDTIHVTVEEQVALFIHIVGHHAKNRAIKIDFIRSGATVSRYFNDVLQAICNIRHLFVKQPGTSIHPDIEFNPNFYSFFKDCIGFVDGTHIDARVSADLMSKFRGRKGITQNVLAACDLDLKFTYVLAGWEGSANDYLVLKDALSRPPPYGLHIPPGKYYLVDAGYTTTHGFISPYRKVRYHLREQAGRRPQNAKELFNLRHSQLRTRIERAFGILKNRFRILDSRPFYPFKTQVDIVLGCCVLHNFVREVDPNDIVVQEIIRDEDEILTHEPPTILGERRERQAQWMELREKIKDDMWQDYVSSSRVFGAPS